MNDSGKPRRRIAPPEGPRRSGGGGKTDPWIITIIAAVVVVAGGWFLGQGLAHMLGPRDQQRSVASAPTSVAVTPVPSASASPLPSPSVSPRSSTSPHPVVKPAATPSKKPTAPPVTPTPAAPATKAPPTPSPTPALLPKPTATPVPHVAHAAATAAPKPPPPAPAAEENLGEATVRAYIDALRRGDPTAATAYLGNGAPDEDFIDESTRVQSLTSSANGDGSYRVRVTMQTSKGQFKETFVVAGSGNSARILEKMASKP